LLFLNGSPKPLTTSVLLSAKASSDPSRFAYITHEQETLNVHVQDDTLLKDRKVFSQPFQSKNTYHLSWSSDDQYLLLEERSIKSTYTLLDVRLNAQIKLPFKEVTGVHFDIGSPHHLFYQQNKMWNIFDPETNAVIPKKISADDLRSADGKFITIQSTNQSVVSYLDESGIASIIAYLPLGNYRFSRSQHPFITLTETTHKRVVVLDPSQKEPLRLNEPALFYAWSEKEALVLLSDGFDTKIFHAMTGDVQTITRFSESIRALGWYPLHDEILFAQKDNIYGLELDDRDTRNQTKLVEGYSVETFWISKDGSSLFFFGKDMHGTYGVYERKLQK
ncbi:MAG: hypothetical protein AAB664_00025, partial [Patescibacteria group bacterium]